MVLMEANVSLIYFSLIFCMTFVFDCRGESSVRDRRALDRLGSGLLKRSGLYITNKRHLDRLTSGFIKRNGDQVINDAVLKLEYYLAQTLLNKLRTKGMNVLPEDRQTDGIGMGLGQKNDLDTVGSGISKSNLDRIGMDLIQRDHMDNTINEEKRRLDRLGSGFIKKRDEDVDTQVSKRYLDRLGSGLIKRKEEQKHYIDRLGSGLL